MNELLICSAMWKNFKNTLSEKDNKKYILYGSIYHNLQKAYQCLSEVWVREWIEAWEPCEGIEIF